MYTKKSRGEKGYRNPIL